MRKLHINFAPPSIARSLYTSHPLVLVLLVLGLGACGVGGWKLQRLLESNNAAQSRVAGLRSKLHAHEVAIAPVPVAKLSADQANVINAAIQQLNLPWRDVLDAVESATPDHIALISLEPDARHSSIKITAGASSGDEMIAYIQELKQQDTLLNVTLLHHEINAQDANHPVRFQLVANWKAVQS